MSNKILNRVTFKIKSGYYREFDTRDYETTWECVRKNDQKQK